MQQRDTPLPPFKWKQLTYISCSTYTMHLNERAVHCISVCMRFFVPLPHKQLAHFTQTGGGYVMSYAQRGLAHNVHVMINRAAVYARFRFVQNNIYLCISNG